MVCTIRGKRSHFCMGRAQLIQCAVTQHSRAVGCRHMCPTLTDTHLVNPPIKPSVGYPVGSVTKNWFCCQQNQSFKEDVCCLSWLSVIVCALLQNKAPFFDPPVSCRTPCWPPNCRWLVTVLPQGNVILHFELFFIAFLVVVWGRGQRCGNSCFSGPKCNWVSLCMTAWVFVDVERELGTPVFHLSPITPPDIACHH